MTGMVALAAVAGLVLLTAGAEFLGRGASALALRLISRSGCLVSRREGVLLVLC